MAMDRVRIVLVAPAGPLNVGSVARVMKNFDLSQLYLVDPQCDRLGTEALQMAVHADDLLHSARCVQTIPEALVGCEYAIATTARTRGFDTSLDPPEIALPNLLLSESGKARTSGTALIFGPEDRGLSNQELTYAQQFLKIPTSDTYSALNLAQAVAICCYELSQVSASLQKPPSSGKQSESVSLIAAKAEPQEQSSTKQNAKLEELEGYCQHLESLLLDVGYLHTHTSASRMRKLRRILNRATLTSDEVALLRGMIRQTEWALSQPNDHSSNHSNNANPNG
ncbi:MAG: RNA methyltransferase [Cyanobacteria bacterium P01_D01_bin.1]